jgi:hypothetical protein
MAQSLLRLGVANSVFSRLVAAKQKGDLTCAIFEPTNEDGSSGHCGQHEYRPSLCRLFGSSDQLADELLRLRSSSGSPSEQTPLPINEALYRALSKALTEAMYAPYADVEEVTEEPEAEDTARMELKEWAAARVAAKEAAEGIWKEDDPIQSQSSFGRPLTSEERRERARLEGPWQSTKYELYHWLSPLAKLTRGNVQDEMVERLVVDAIPDGASLGTATSVATGAWPRDAYLEGSARSFTVVAPPDQSMETVSYAPLVLHEIPYEGAGVGHSVWDSAIVLTMFLRSPAGILLLTESIDGLADVLTGSGHRLPRVLELGAGLGLPGRDLAACGAATVTLSDSRVRLLEQLDHGTSANAIKLNWNEPSDVAAAVAANYDVVIASDVAYYHPDVAPLANALRSMNAAVSVVVAPMHREAAHELSDELHARGGTVVEHAMTLVSSDADGWQGSSPPLCEAVSEMPALAYRVLVVTWPDTGSDTLHLQGQRA